MKNILFAASEATPFIKTGGLADVIGSLPQAVSDDEYDIRVILPKYRQISNISDINFIGWFMTDLDNRQYYTGLFELNRNGITYYFIDNEEFFGLDYIYGDNTISEAKRFAFFSKAILESLKYLCLRIDIIHCHDWQTALIPIYLKENYAKDPFFFNTKTILTIHNLKFQCRTNLSTLKQITGLYENAFSYDHLEYYGDANLLKGGLAYADLITTVSPTYAKEIETPLYGEGLDSLLRYRHFDLFGILNGIDTTIFNPEDDPLIYKNYTVSNFRKIKKINKAGLFKLCNFNNDLKCMTIGIVSRMTDQKGFNIIGDILDTLLANDAVKLVVLGTGEHHYEDMFRYFKNKYPDSIQIFFEYNEHLAHKIYAGSDLFLMPSLFEPCGLAQMIALRYGTLPLVRETGGLKDSIEIADFTLKGGDGFGFEAYNSYELLKTIRFAQNVFYDHKRQWNEMVARAMEQDFSWYKSAAEYKKIYVKLLTK